MESYITIWSISSGTNSESCVWHIWRHLIHWNLLAYKVWKHEDLSNQNGHKNSQLHLKLTLPEWIWMFIISFFIQQKWRIRKGSVPKLWIMSWLYNYRNKYLVKGNYSQTQTSVRFIAKIDVNSIKPYFLRLCFFF